MDQNIKIWRKSFEQVSSLGQDGEVEGEAGERADAVSHVEGEGVGALVRHGLDVVEAALVDDRLVEHGDLRAASSLETYAHMPDSIYTACRDSLPQTEKKDIRLERWWAPSPVAAAYPGRSRL